MLDLKSADNRVHRDQLVEILLQVIDHNLAAQIEYMMHPKTFRTIGNDQMKREKMTQEAPQGYPVSPTLLNMFKEPLLGK